MASRSSLRDCGLHWTVSSRGERAHESVHQFSNAFQPHYAANIFPCPRSGRDSRVGLARATGDVALLCCGKALTRSTRSSRIRGMIGRRRQELKLPLPSLFYSATMPPRNRHRLEDDEDDEETPDEIEEVELEAVVWYLRHSACRIPHSPTCKFTRLFCSSRRTKN